MGALDSIRQARAAQEQAQQQQQYVGPILEWRMFRRASAEWILYSIPVQLLADVFWPTPSFFLPSTDIYWPWFLIIALGILQPTAKNISQQTSLGWRRIFASIMSWRLGPLTVFLLFTLNAVFAILEHPVPDPSFHSMIWAGITGIICGVTWYKLVFGKKTVALAQASASIG
jgi:hypothetical protein